MMALADDKIRRIRKIGAELSPRWRLPEEAVGPARIDVWLRRLAIAAAASGVLTVVLFIVYYFALRSGVTALNEIAGTAAR
jgi:hypothetical protein